MPTAENDKCTLLEKVILGEIEGKNAAIHAYDGIIWKIRTGYLTLLYAGWAILLNSIVDKTSSPASIGVAGGTGNLPLNGAVASVSYPLQTCSAYNLNEIALAMVLFSLGLAIGGWLIDWTYTRRKARVILALDELIGSIHKSGKDSSAIDVKLLQVAGDNPSREHSSKGYWEAMRGGLYVFFIPLFTLIAAAICVL